MIELRRIEYSEGDTALSGLHARPAGADRGDVRGAVTIYPTFINSTPGVEAKARLLVEAGYEVLIADFYGPDAPGNPEQAFAAMTTLRSNPDAMRRRLRAALIKMRELAPDAPQFAIGFCLGGMAVLEMARDGADLVAVASFHGLLETPLPAKAPIKPRILVCHGDADSLVPRGQVIAFWEEMDAVKADWHFHSYAGVAHGFTNPATFDGSPNPAYNASADRQSWRAMMDFFAESLG